MLNIEDIVPGMRIKVIRGIGALIECGYEATIKQVVHEKNFSNPNTQNTVAVVQFDGDDYDTDIYLSIWHEHFEVVK